MNDEDFENLDIAFNKELSKPQKVELINFFKRITTWDLAWMMCKLTFAWFLAMPIFLVVVAIWALILFVLFPTAIISLMDGITIWLKFLTDFLKER